MEYLKRVLGIKVRYENKTVDHLPNFIRTRYILQRVYLDAQKAVFLYPKSELEQIVTLKKHLERVQKSADCPVILVLEKITARQKEYLLRDKIAFIVEGKQIYLPFMAVYLQERCSAEKCHGKKYFHRRRCFYCISFMEAHRNYPQVRLRRTWN